METDISLGEQYHNIALMMFTSQRLYDIIIVFSKYYAKRCSLFKIKFWRTSVLSWGHWYSCFQHLVMSVSRLRWIPLLTCFIACIWWILQIYLWCGTCRPPLDGQHGCLVTSMHLLFEAIVGDKLMSQYVVGLNIVIHGKFWLLSDIFAFSKHNSCIKISYKNINQF